MNYKEVNMTEKAKETDVPEQVVASIQCAVYRDVIAALGKIQITGSYRADIQQGMWMMRHQIMKNLLESLSIVENDAGKPWRMNCQET